MLLLQVLLWQLFLAKSSTDELLHLADQSSILASYVVTIVGGSAYIQSGDFCSFNPAICSLFSIRFTNGWLTGWENYSKQDKSVLYLELSCSAK